NIIYFGFSDKVMSDLEDSIISYTVVSSPYGGLLDIGSLGVDGLPVMLEDTYTYVVAAFHAPPSPDYVPGPEYPPSSEFVPEPVYPEFMPAEDDILSVEEKPLPERRADIDIEGDEEEDEYLAPTDSTAVALPAIDHAPSAEETEPFETDESTATPPPPHPIPSPPLPLLSPPPTDPTYEESPFGYRAAKLQWRDEREEIPEEDLQLRKRLCTAHTGTYELGESSAAAAARLSEPIRDDLYRFVDTVERGEGSTPAAM
nr:hypothetical protein [Tanacetum cinerariifolium]